MTESFRGPWAPGQSLELHSADLARVDVASSDLKTANRGPRPAGRGWPRRKDRSRRQVRCVSLGRFRFTWFGYFDPGPRFGRTVGGATRNCVTACRVRRAVVGARRNEPRGACICGYPLPNALGGAFSVSRETWRSNFAAVRALPRSRVHHLGQRRSGPASCGRHRVPVPPTESTQRHTMRRGSQGEPRRLGRVLSVYRAVGHLLESVAAVGCGLSRVFGDTAGLLPGGDPGRFLLCAGRADAGTIASPGRSCP